LAKNLSLPKRFSTSQSAQLALLAGLSGLIYLLVFTLPFPLHGLYQTIPPVDYTKLTHYSRSGFIAYVVSLAALFALYIGAIRLTMPVGAGEWATRGTREKTELFSFIFIASAILAGILIFSYPVTAIDLFIYAIRTRGWALYGLNPLATPPEALPAADPWLGLAAGPGLPGLCLAGLSYFATASTPLGYHQRDCICLESFDPAGKHPEWTQ
jgi:hypothetical protein